MKNCIDCKHAEWKKTAAGKLHPSGDGVCAMIRTYDIPTLPQSMYWIGGKPKACGGYINRRNEYSDHCAYYQIKAVKAEHELGRLTKEKRSGGSEL